MLFQIATLLDLSLPSVSATYYTFKEAFFDKPISMAITYSVPTHSPFAPTHIHSILLNYFVFLHNTYYYLIGKKEIQYNLPLIPSIKPS